MKYQIITTLGPASRDESCWQAFVQAGATGFRLNTAHLSLPQLSSWIDRMGAFLASNGSQATLVLDLQGSKWRLGSFEPLVLETGQTVELALPAAGELKGALPVPHPDFFSAAPHSSGEIALDDAKILLRVEASAAGRLSARVVRGGEIRPAKGITFTGGEFRNEALSEKDVRILELAQPHRFIRYAVSYVKDVAEMERYRRQIGPQAYLIAKLERGPAIADALAIAGPADELWVCRGDLGAELGLRAMAKAVARITQQLRQIKAPVIMAGQVLEHMVASPAPTRSEVCYLYDCLANGYRGFVLSDETAIGPHPLASCRAAAIFLEAESGAAA